MTAHPVPRVAAAHPSQRFGPETRALLERVTGLEVVCVDTSAPTLVEMVDEVEDARGADPWVFWGMSGGGWLAQIYADRHPEALAGVVIESVGRCFRERLADPRCAISPRFPAWRAALEAAGLLGEDSGGPTVWQSVLGVGEVWRRVGGPALVVSPVPVGDAMKAVMPELYAFDGRGLAGGVPALVIAGEDDPIVPVDHVRAVHEAFAGSTFLVVPGAGHVPTAQERPEVGEAFARFLAGVAP